MNYNIYCDESCHLENDGINVMVLGSIWCPKNKVKDINEKICQIKCNNGLSKTAEMKWSKIGPAKFQLYKDLVNYFFDDPSLHYRAVVIPNKSLLDHKRFNQTHDLWYYKMYYEMLKAIISKSNIYEVYIDIKDTHTNTKAQKLRQVCSNSLHDTSGTIIKRLQPIRSEEVQIMQIVDVISGALAYRNRIFPDGYMRSSAKQGIIEQIKNRSGYDLKGKTTLYEEKLNLFFWDAR